MPFILDLELKLSPEKALARLLENTVAVESLVWSLPPASANEKIISRIEGNLVGMRVKHWYSNGFTSFFRGAVTRSVAGSRLQGEFYVLKSVQILMLLIILTFASITWIFLALEEMPAEPKTFLGIMMTVEFMTLFVVWVVGRNFGKRDEIQMLQFLNNVFKDVRS